MKLNQRQWSFVGLFIVVVGCLLAQLKPSIVVNEATRTVFDLIDSLPPQSRILLSFDHDASALPEIKPLSLAVVRHAFSKGHRLIGLALLAEGAGAGSAQLRELAEREGKVYGLDYAFLGFKPQATAAILGMGESFRNTWPADYLGTPIDSLPVLHGMANYDSVALVLSVADGNGTTQWIEYGTARFEIRVVAVVTAAMMTAYDPYLASGQLSGMLGGLRQAAEYEQLLGLVGGGSRGLLAQSGAHLYILALVLLGNIWHWRMRKHGKAND